MDRGLGRADGQELAHQYGRSERRAVRRGQRGVFLLLVLLGFSFAVGCAKEPQPDTADSRELRAAFPEGNVAGTELGPGQLANLLTLEGLTAERTADGRALPRLAESWRWEDDGLTLRITLRPQVYFHDGTPFTAKAVADILAKIVARPTSQYSYASLGDIATIEAPDDRTLRLGLTRRSAFLPDDLSVPLSLGANIGTGPYQLAHRDKSELFFTRFDRYYQGTPEIRAIRVRTFDTLRTAWASLLRGEVDMVTDVPADAVEFIRTDDVDVITYERFYQFLVGFNSQKGAFRSPAVRRALNVAVDRQGLIQRALKGFGTPSTGPLWPKHWAYNSSVAAFAEDRQAAGALLDSAGYPRGAAGATSAIPNARFRFTCLLPANFSLLERIGLEIQKQLYDVGVDMQFEVLAADEYDRRLRSRQFEAVLVDMISGPTLARSYIFWRSAATFKGLNVFGYENPEAELQFMQLRDASMNEAATRSAIHRLQRSFLDDPPALFLAWNHRTRVVKGGYELVRDPDRDPLFTVERWTTGRAEAALNR